MGRYNLFMKTHLIAIDGLDGSGKQTQTELLGKTLSENKIPYRCLSFPTYDDEMCAQVKMYLSGRFGDDPNAVNAYAASSFFGVDRYCSYMLDWKKDYEAGKVILANRYTSANAVHQLSKLGESEGKEFLKWLMDFEFGKLGIPKPDAVVYLCLPPEISRELIEKRSRETGVKMDIHERNFDYLEKSYKAALYSASELGWITIDCSENGRIRTREDIHEEMVARIKKIMPELDI